MNDIPVTPQISMDEAIMAYLSHSDYASAGTLYMQFYNHEQSDVMLLNALWCLRHAVVQLGLLDEDAMVAHAAKCVELARMIQTVESVA